MNQKVDPNTIVNVSMPFAVVTYLKGLVAQRPITEAEAVYGLLRHVEQQAQLQAMAEKDAPVAAPETEDASEGADAEQTEEA